MAPNPFADAHELPEVGKSKKLGRSSNDVIEEMVCRCHESLDRRRLCESGGISTVGRGAPWQSSSMENQPRLVVPLSPDAEHSLMSLATKPDLADPRVEQ